MKKLFFIIILLIISKVAFCQQWSNENRNFYQIQKEFNDYWNKINVKNGLYTLDNEEHKAGGWKQFKRWEWFWSTRIDPVTGNFPSTSSYYESQKIQFKNATNSGNWTTFGPSTSRGGYAGIGRVNCVGFSINDNNILYSGAASGGLWKSYNNGFSWVPLSDANSVLGISDIIVQSDGTNDIIYVATGDRDSKDNYSVGILKSNDGGNTWNITGLNWMQSQLRTINRLLADPYNDKIIYAATSVGLFKSTDGGAIWTNLTTTVFGDIEFKPGSNQIMYASTRSGGDVYLSSNGGSTWTNVLNTTGTRTELSVSPSNVNIVYVLIANTSNGLFGIYKSINSGLSFEQVFASINLLGWNCSGSDTGGQAWYDLCLISDPNNSDIVFTGGVNTWKSVDGGITWKINNHWASTCSSTAKVVHADKHYFAYHPKTNELYECNDGGLYRSPDNGTTWTDITNSMIISQIYRLGVSQTASNTIITGLQDNGTKAMLNGTWKDVIGGDGMECIIDYTNANTQYGELYYGSIYRTDNQWTSSTIITSSLNESAAWVTPYVIDPKTSSTIYIGLVNVWKSIDKGANWTKLGTISTSGALTSLCVSPSNSNIIYAARGSSIYKTIDGGITWTTITNNLPVNTNSITYISVKYNDPNTIWVSLGQFNSNCVYQSTDGGSTWVNISAGLPSVPTNCVIENRQNTTNVELYAGTDIGVYVKSGGDNWIKFNDGLPNVVVNELEIYYSNDPSLSRIRAATYGRGLWESTLYSGTATINYPPEFKTDPIIEANAIVGMPYNSSLSDNAYDPNVGDILTFTLVSGPSWLSISSNGTLSGIPTINDVGTNLFNIRVEDNKGGVDTGVLEILVINNIVEYCIPSNINNSTDYIISVGIGSTISTTNKSTTGYEYYSSPVFNLQMGNIYTMNLKPLKTNIKEFWRVWIDYNHDGDFTESNELVLNLPNKRGSTRGTFTVPLNVYTGETRMRVVMKNLSFANSCDNNYVGEVEDYNVNLIFSPSISEPENTVTSLNLYPNPANDEINIHVENLEEQSKIHIYSVTGVKINQFNINTSHFVLDIKNYTSGIYYVILESSSERIHKKFIKQ